MDRNTQWMVENGLTPLPRPGEKLLQAHAVQDRSACLPVGVFHFAVFHVERIPGGRSSVNELMGWTDVCPIGRALPRAGTGPRAREPPTHHDARSRPVARRPASARPHTSVEYPLTARPRRLTIPIADTADRATRFSSTGFIRTDPRRWCTSGNEAVQMKPFSLARR